MRVRHRFANRGIDPQTKILVVGTFNPDLTAETKKGDADFFYSRSRNYLWILLPKAFGEAGLKCATRAEKEDFIRRRNIDFIDIILEVEVDEGGERNYADIYLDKHVTAWRNVIELIDTLPCLERACFTRKTFAGVPCIEHHVSQLESYISKRGLPFARLVSPARYYGKDGKKQNEWNQFLLPKDT